MTNAKFTIVLFAALLIAISMSACSTPSVNGNEDLTASVTDPNHGQNDTADSDMKQDPVRDPAGEDTALFFVVPTESDTVLPEGLSHAKSQQHAGIATRYVRVKDEALLDRTVASSYGKFHYKTTEKSLLTVNDGEYGTFYSSYDIYKSESGAEMRFLSGTDLMTFYVNQDHASGDAAQEELTEEEATTIANEFLNSILPAGIVAEIPWVDTHKANYGGKTIFVTYCRRIHGYNTDEAIMVGIDMASREVDGYNGEGVGKYAELQHELTQEALDRTYGVLRNKVESLELNCVEITDTCLVTNTTGAVYMAMTFSYAPAEAEDNRESQQIVTKVELPAT